MTWIFWTISIAVLIVGLLVVAAIGRGIARGVAPEVKLKSIRPERLGAGEQSIRALLEIRNPNPIPLPVRTLTYRVWLGGQEIASGEGRFQRWIPANDMEFTEVLVIGDAARLARALPRLALTPQPWPYRLTGTLTPFGSLRIAYEHRGEIDAQGILSLAASLR
jgi:LEA14-like dessication related protein